MDFYFFFGTIVDVDTWKKGSSQLWARQVIAAQCQPDDCRWSRGGISLDRLSSMS